MSLLHIISTMSGKNNLRKIAFIGYGHMAGALVRGLVDAGQWPPDNIFIIERNEGASLSLRQDTGVRMAKAVTELPADVDAIIIAVRPTDVLSACAGIANNITLISVAAGISIETLKKWLGRNDASAIARVMPNMPSSLGYGMSVCCGSDDTREVVSDIFSAVGKVLWTDDESMLAAATAVSGSGPGYLYYFMEALTEAALDLGLPADLAEKLVEQTVVGGAILATTSAKTPAELCQSVAVKGWTTEQAISCLEALDFKNIVSQALRVAHKRAKEIGKADAD